MHGQVPEVFPEVSGGIVEDKEVIIVNSVAPWSEDEASVTN